MLRYALTIFLSAFLLFQVQPLIAKFILPWFGGGPAVWTACMLFFQVVLLAGYCYAHLLTSRLGTRAQVFLHVGLLVVSLVLLPIGPSPELWKPEGSEWPVARIMLLLTATIGLPYFLLSSTAPLVQQVFHRATGQAPYRLYALSNAGSLLALVSYPFVFEPQLTLRVQTWAWSVGYALFATACGWVMWKQLGEAELAPAARTRTKQADEHSARPSWGIVILWVALAACGSVALLATTNQMAQEIPSVPLLWVLPLALYLLSFIICFDHDRWYRRAVFWALLVPAVGASCYAIWSSSQMPINQLLVIYAATLFACVMVCHGELARLRPPPAHVTFFYLMVSAGGAVGGLLVAVVAPLVLPDYWEYQISLVATVALAAIAAIVASERNSAERFADRPHSTGLREPEGWWIVRLAKWGLGAEIVLAAAAAVVIASNRRPDNGVQRTPVATTRNFYGVLRVTDNVVPGHAFGPYRLLTNGHIDHGAQYLDADKARWPTTYYVYNSGIGRAIGRHPRRNAADPAERGLKIGVVGLGAGTIAALCQPGDSITFYEISPDVEHVARTYFSFLKDSSGKVDVIVGDARIEMERQLAAGHPQQFDVLAIDAFSSDSIPMHLLTLECVRLYRQHLKPDGILCVHISNLFLDLSTVVRGIAAEEELPCEFLEIYHNQPPNAHFSVWGLLTTNEAFWRDPEIVAQLANSRKYTNPPLVWRDDYGSLWQVVGDLDSRTKMRGTP